MLAHLSFEVPGYLALLAALPLLIVLSFRSLSGLGPVRRIVALAARCIVVVCMCLALAGAHRVRTTDEAAVIFVVDRSSSIPRGQASRSLAFLQEAEKGRRPGDRVAVISFDGKSAVEQLPMSVLAIERLTEPVRPDETNLSGALRMALALFPPGVMRRVVLVSDGNENVGDALADADQYRAAGVPIDVAPVRYAHRNEILVERLSAPPTAAADETVSLQCVIRSEQPASGRLKIRHNGELLPIGPGGSTEYGVALDAGPNRIPISVPLRAAGAHRFEATFEPDDAAQDTIAENNTGRAFTVVSGPGRILILTTQDDRRSAQLLAAALAREQLAADVEIVGSAPIDAVRLIEYSLVVLSNVPAPLVREEERQTLATYVRDLGGGLLMVGGDQTFGAGGWMDTPIEEVMPVSFDIKSKKQIPKGALVLVMHACEIPEGNYWGERVAVAAVKTLSSRDLVGVLSWQWGGAAVQNWVVPLQVVGSKNAIIQALTRMQMGDMPSLENVAAQGVDALEQRRDASVKHMIIISDFDPDGPSDATIARMKKLGITCSTVAIGYGSHWIDEPKARSIATRTGGKFYTTTNYSELPQIFIKESMIVRRTLVQDGTFAPRLVNPISPTVQGLSGDAIPPLHGYVLTTPKPLADIPLIRRTEDSDDPVLAQWQVGLGKTVAFTSGMWDRWGTDWTQWSKFSKLWAQIARWASRQSDAAAFGVSSTVGGGRGRIRVDALDADAAAINFMTIEGSLLNPAAPGATPLRLTQTGPGRYEAEFDAREAGNYIVNLAYRMGSGEDARRGTLQTGVSVAYSAEHRDLSSNVALLDAIARRTGGRELTGGNAQAAFSLEGLARPTARQPIWEDLVRLMLLLFLIDVAVRRIAINPLEMLRRLRRFIAEVGGQRAPAEASATVLTTLKGSRDEARAARSAAGRESAQTGAAGGAPAARFEAREDAKSSADLARALGGASETDQPVVARPTRKPTATNEADYTSRLLKAKKRAREDMKPDEREEGER
ncbi:MAG: VWA domain-containing protein [Planctomycetia bacterium]|nr:MAG: VWA domain-containing protein [Planctomycetia bacterium]